MTGRTVSSTVTFVHPFRIDGTAEPWPAGLYEIETDEEDLDSLTIAGRRRIRTIIYRRDARRGTSEAVEVSPEALDAALRDDAARNDAARNDEPGNDAVTVATAHPHRADPEPAAPEPRFTPIWVVPLALSLVILAAAFYGPFAPPGSVADTAAAGQRP